MTIVIKKGDSKEINQEKINRLQKNSIKQKQKSFMEFCGALRGVFKKTESLFNAN